MPTPRNVIALALGAAAAAATLAGPASAQPRYDNAYGDRPYGDRADERPADRSYGDRSYDLVAPGVPLLLPELRDTARGRAFVLREFDFNHDGIVQRGEAEAADRAFQDGHGFGRSWDDRRYDDRREDRRYDDRREAEPPPPPPPQSDG